MNRTLLKIFLSFALGMGTTACLKKGELTWNGEINLGSGGGGPSTPSIVINGGGSYATSTGATLNLSAPGYSEMYITTVAGCASGGSWQPFTSTQPYTLSPNVTNTVYVKYRTATLVESSCISASVIHDSIAPTVGIATPVTASYINAASDSFSYSVTGSCNETSQAVIIKVDGSTSGLNQSGGICNGSTFSATIDTTGLSQAAHSFTAELSDAAGNLGSSSSVTVTRDVTAPSIALSTPANSTYINLLNNSSSFSVTGTCSEVSQVVIIRVNGSTAGLSQAGGLCDGSSFSASVSTMGLSAGPHTFTAELSDPALNTATSTSHTVTKDVGSPSVAISSPANSSYINISSNSPTFPVSGTCNEVSQTVVIKIDGSTAGVFQSGGLCDGTNFSATVSTTGFAPGVHTFTAELSDGAGNLTTSSSNSVTKDVSAPTVALTTPSNSSYINAASNSPSFSVSGTCSEASQSVIIKVDGSTAGLSQTGGLCNGSSFGASISTTSLSPGAHTFTAELSDAAGNLTTSTSNSVTKDVTPPMVTISTPANSSYINISNNSTTFSVSGSCNEASQTVTIRVGGSTAGLSQSGGTCNGTTFSATINTTGLSPAAHNFTAELSDGAGNLTTSASNTVTKDVTAPTIAISTPANSTYINISNDSSSFSVSGTCSEASQTVTIKVDGSTAGLSQTGGLCNGSSFSASVDTTGLSDAVHNFTAEISDIAGNQVTSVSNSVSKDVIAPTVAISTPANSSYINASSNSGSFSVTGTCNEPSQTVTIKVDGSTSGLSQVGGTCVGSSFSATIDTLSMGQGAHNFTAELSDGAGNLGTSASHSVTKDSIYPTVALSTPGNGIYINALSNSASYSVSGTCSEASQLVTIKVDGSTTGLSQTGGTCNGTSFSAQVSTLGLGETALAFSAEITDLAGNFMASGSNVVTKDVTPPTWSTPGLSHPATFNSLSNSPTLAYNLSATDAVSGIAGYDYALGTGTAGASQSNIFPWSSAGGSPIIASGLLLTNIHTFYLNMRVRDNAGNLTSVFSSSGWVVPLVVVPAYTNGANWNDYVKNDGGTIWTATNVPCAGTEGPTYHGCIHGGEMRKVVVTGTSTCGGLTMTDFRGIFDWNICIPGAGTVTFYSSLKKNKGLKDLIHPAGNAWQTNNVSLSGTYTATSPLSTWHTNPVVVLPASLPTAIALDGTDNDGAGFDAPFSPGTVFTVTSNSTSNGYNLNLDKLAIVTMGLSKLTYGGSATTNCNYTTGEMATPGDKCLLSTGGQKFLWIEGEYEGFLSGTSATITLNMANTTFSKLHQVRSYSGTTDVMSMLTSHKNYFYDLTLQNGYDGLWLDQSTNNTISQLKIVNASTIGLRVIASTGNRFNDVSVSNNTNQGMVISTTSNGNTFDGLFAYNNAGSGIELNGTNVQNNTFTRVISTSNVGAGIDILNSPNNYFSRMTLAYNTLQNFYMQNATGNTIHNMIAYYSYDNIYVVDSQSNTFSQIITTDWTSGGSPIYLESSTSQSNKFSGNFFVDGPCWIAGSAIGLTNSTCAPNGPSTGTLSVSPGASIDTSGSLVGAIPSDTFNISDSGGMAPYPGISLTFDWFNFDNFYRTWGHASIGNLRWASGTGRIWDWQVRSTDPLFLGKAGNGSTVETFVPGSPCPASVGGSNIISNMQGTPVTYLKNAVELVNDPILNPTGDNNGLCESNEACLFTPNFGAYQGHGTSGSCTFSGGTIVNVTMYGFNSNGI